MVTTFGDAVQVVVNYNREAVEVAGQTVPALDYLVIEGVRL